MKRMILAVVGMRTSVKLMLWATLPLVVASACRGPTDASFDQEEQVGSIEIMTTTTGAMVDPNGYTVIIDEGAIRPIGINAEVEFSGLRVGRYQIQLSDVASNCVVAGQNPRLTTVTALNVSQVEFLVECA